VTSWSLPVGLRPTGFREKSRRIARNPHLMVYCASRKIVLWGRRQTHAWLVAMTVSFGVTSLDKSEELNTPRKRVDDALYMAKTNGRNRVEVLGAHRR
jgi:GGDEF domain-containing protein